MRRSKLEAAQQRMLANGGSVPVQPMPILFAAQIQAAALKALREIDGLHPLVESALAVALPLAIHHMENVIVAPDSAVSERTTASMALFFLMDTLQRADVKRRQLEAKKAVAAKARERHQADKARANRDLAQVPLIIEKKRKALDKKLKKALAEIDTPKGTNEPQHSA